MKLLYSELSYCSISSSEEVSHHLLPEKLLGRVTMKGNIWIQDKCSVIAVSLSMYSEDNFKLLQIIKMSDVGSDGGVGVANFH